MKENTRPSYVVYSIWALDFIRVLNERPAVIKILLRFIFGKYAYREFVGLVESFQKDNWFDPFMDYDLWDVDYHTDRVGLKWWKEL